ncbi:peroxisomal succinyl-coenzyme A thioesterase-like isoform X4 [Siniperca chuatsi]|uniref:peroxisomal succinyl-coenzyme A thioesterase-like isoform X4 n=1 Tax=Siniperca chuatsi TaxID=119488 RepID=UPI001CE15B97|nr:peroxisomal succinyl-coenzyme A thioesterase-like isoform X4 [Siniperca chuatsi]
MIFDEERLPSKVRVGYMSYEVRPYNHPPLRCCFECQKYVHVAVMCAQANKDAGGVPVNTNTESVKEELSLSATAVEGNSALLTGGARLRKKNVETPYIVFMSLLEGHVSPRERRSTELAAVTIERWYMAPGVQRIEIRQNGVVGTLFLPPGPGPFPAMLDLWGMGGGLPEYRSALFASRGYASLSLAYVGHKELPGPQNRINVGDSYFKSAFHLLQDHHQVCADRVGIIGLSFGVYLTLRIATQTGVKPSCLICINGPVGSTIKLSDADGKTVQFESDQKYWTYDDQGHVSFRDVSLPANLLPESKVKLEHLACPLMYIVGEDDLSASSIENANLIEETLRAAGKSQLFTRLSYPGAGHLIEPPYTPNSRASLWSVKPIKRITLWGGHLAPHAAAQEDAWKKILDFMESVLRQ